MQVTASQATHCHLATATTKSARRHLPAILLSPISIAALVVALFVAWLVRRLVVVRHLSRKYRRQDLLGDIARFYDVRSAAWEYVWGEHMHHGLYDVVDGHRLAGVNAQLRTMQQLLQFACVDATTAPAASRSGAPVRVLDVGCGIGGASRYLARQLSGEGDRTQACHVTGITLSGKQAQRASELNAKAGLSDVVNVRVLDALNTGFETGHFDVVWSLESGEHMENKHRFISECARVLAPGGKIAVLAWCLRETTPALSRAEQFAIRRIMEQYCLPRVAPGSEYADEMVRAGLRRVIVEDWTERAAPFWNEVVRSAVLDPKGWCALRETGWPLISSALAMRHVIRGIKLGVFRLVALTAEMPTEQQIEEEGHNAIKC